MFLRGSDPDHSRRRFTRRAMLVAGLQGAGFAVLAGRLYQLQVMDGRLYAPLADDNRITVQGVAPLRGRIFDRTGKLLAYNDESFQLQVIPALTRDLRGVLERLAHVYPAAGQAIEDVLVRAKRQSRNIPIEIADGLSWEETARINIHAPQLPGVVTVVVGQRRYAGGIAMGHVVGFVGPVERYALDDPPLFRLPGVRIGKAGVEAGADAHLRGRAGAVRREVDARGRVVRELGRTESRAGGDIVVTIDSDLQEATRQRLLAHRRASAVVLDVRTGEIAALVSVPGFDPSPLLTGISNADWRRLVGSKDDPLLNRAVQGQYPPGSTFKMVTALAALEAGVVGPDDPVTCTGAVELAGQAFRCWKRSGHGACNLHRALGESCDVYFYEIARRTGISRISEMGRRLGLGQVHPLGLPGQKAGVLPDPDWKRGALGKPWYDGETLIAGIGQGYVLSTPLQLAVMTARLATGRSVSPSLFRRADEGYAGGQMDKRLPLGIAEAHLTAMRRAMWGVVNEPGGTGRQAQLPFSGFAVAGKTGTSQVTRLSSLRAPETLAWHHRDHALFVGYAGPENEGPAYAAAAIVEHGGSGGKVAAPLVAEVLGDALLLDPARRAPFQPKGQPA